jgi:hypothetical protein
MIGEENLTVSHVELYHKLGVIEGKLDSLVGLETRIQNSLSDVDRRINMLEKWRWFIIGISTAVATAAGFLAEALIR